MKQKTYNKGPFLTGQITRREFGRKVGALGVASTAAGSLLTMSGSAFAATPHWWAYEGWSCSWLHH